MWTTTPVQPVRTSGPETLDKCVGMTVFCYQYLWDVSTGAIISGTLQEHTAFSAHLKVATWH